VGNATIVAVARGMKGGSNVKSKVKKQIIARRRVKRNRNKPSKLRWRVFLRSYNHIGG
jgi:hypothetical protein